MCGIAGYFSRTGAPPDRSILERMTTAVAHRGPDGDGILIDGPIGFGHRRLAIIDLSIEANQPMRCGASGRQIIFNGEIYNYRELRVELQDGYAFRTSSDTEVILAAYDRWGAACVERFNGMWSFAILDRHNDTVFCSRDRFGVKPFYYVDTPGFFAFGSEARQLLPLLPNRHATHEVLYDYLGLAEDEWGSETFFAGVRRLPPGHNLSYKISTGAFTIARHYRVPKRDDLKNLTPAEASEALRALLVDAVSLRLRSDVTVGTCLSGGLDSSSLASIAARLARESGAPQFASVTAVSEAKATDESAFAQTVATHAKLKAFFVRPDFARFYESIGEVIRAQEEPFLTPSVFMQFFVMKEARRQGVPVLLDGQGGDETLLGYERYVVPALRELYRRRGLFSVMTEMRLLADNNPKMGLPAQMLYLGYFSDPSLRWYRNRHRLGNPPWFPGLKRFRQKMGAAPNTMFEMQRQQVEVDSIPHLLRYEDKNSMWHSVEARLPFLDYRVVEMALNLPTHTKISGGWTKVALRNAMNGYLPDSVAWRKSKLGFNAPDSRWLPRIRELMTTTVKDSLLMREIYRGSRRSLPVESLSDSTLFRFFVASRWADEFGITDISPEATA